MHKFVAAGSGFGCPASAVLGWPEEAPGVQVGVASIGWQGCPDFGVFYAGWGLPL